MGITGHVCHDAGNLEMLFRRRRLEHQDLADRVLAAKIATGRTLGYHDGMGPHQLRSGFPLDQREIEQVEKRRLRITIAFFHELAVFIRHLLFPVLGGHPDNLLDAGNLALHDGSVPKGRRRPIVRQHLPFIQAAFHPIDPVTVMKRVEATFEPYIKQYQQGRTDAHGKAHDMKGGKRFLRPLAFDNLRQIFH